MTRTLLFASAAIGAALLPVGAATAADLARPFDWSGFYAGLHAGWLNGDVHVTDESIPASGNLHGPIAGVLLGYNAPGSPLKPWVVGFEADIGFGDLIGHGCVGDCTQPVLPTFTYDFDWDAHLRVRAGLPTGNVMPFLAGGLAIAQLHVTEDELPIVVGGLYFGATIGGGIDVRLAPGIIGRIEGLYDAYIRKTYEDYSVDFSAWTVRAALIFPLR